MSQQTDQQFGPDWVKDKKTWHKKILIAYARQASVELAKAREEIKELKKDKEFLKSVLAI